MKIGLSSYLFRWAIGTKTFRPSLPMTPVRLVHTAADLNCDLVQIADHPMMEVLSGEELNKLKLAADNRGVELEIGTSGATEARLRRFLDIAEKLESKIVRLVVDGPDAHPSLKEVGALLRKMAPAYSDAGITLAIENHFLIPSPDLAGLIEFVDHPAVGVCLDTANSLACQEWPLDTVRMLAPYAVNVHLKDYVIDPHPEGVGVVVSGSPLGEGRQDMAQIVAVIQSTGKEVNYILEQWLPRQSDEPSTLSTEMDWARRNLAAARRILQERG